MKDITITKDDTLEVHDNSSITIQDDVHAYILSSAQETKLYLNKDAHATIITLRSANVHATLVGDNAKITIINVYRAVDKDIDISATAEHKGLNTTSYIASKGIVSRATSKTRGLIKIAKDAANSDGYQQSDALILEDGKVISIPDLEIHNHQVKCSHGSTITRLDEDKLFYLQSRGLSRQVAKEQLILGFYQEAIMQLPEVLQEKILQVIV